ncbi:thioesterase [Shewanella submarina]|uniref:Thioesterase family protein n=1 Tax=Shewanella submarina TaxID=2016376 RepID=A0ABV7GII8_9GAMM|nr:thioesterase family protein [Shewanella submarina]MCL1036205.1 thioesterase [Shewanella submarina]
MDKLNFSREFHYPVQIFYEDTDFSGVVYHANFLRYFERAREEMIGAKLLKQLWQEQGCGFAVYRCDMTCHQGVEFADILDVRSQVAFESQFRTVWKQSIWREGASRPAVTATIEMVSLGPDKQLIAIPEQVLSRLQQEV